MVGTAQATGQLYKEKEIAKYHTQNTPVWLFLFITIGLSWSVGVCDSLQFGFKCWSLSITIWMADEGLISFLSHYIKPPTPNSAIFL